MINCVNSRHRAEETFRHARIVKLKREQDVRRGFKIEVRMSYSQMKSELTSGIDEGVIDNRNHIYTLKRLRCGVTLRCQPLVLSECQHVRLTFYL
jgi:hypothetical protein